MARWETRGELSVCSRALSIELYERMPVRSRDACITGLRSVNRRPIASRRERSRWSSANHSRVNDADNAVKFFQLRGTRAATRGAMVEAERHLRDVLELPNFEAQQFLAFEQPIDLFRAKRGVIRPAGANPRTSNCLGLTPRIQLALRGPKNPQRYTDIARQMGTLTARSSGLLQC
jgi:hypothetical protein